MDYFKNTFFTPALKWVALSCLIGVLAGSASAAFLCALDAVTQWRGQYRWLIWLLPAAGMLVAWLYRRYGAGSDAGINLLLKETRVPQQTVPLRLAPLVLFGTLTSHLFGASVGREGTAVQMGAALSDQLSKLLRVNHHTRTVIVIAGMAAGFASLFGTPVAGAVWAIEVVALSGMAAGALLPCLLSAVIANVVALMLGAHHVHYAAGAMPALGWMPLLLVAASGVVFGLVARGFCGAIHGLAALFRRHVANSLLRPLIGGAAIVMFAMTVTNADRYLGLGLPVLQAAFSGQVLPQDFLAKLGLTAWSIASGFKGGEVTPLFYVGATLGHVLAPLLHLPPPFLAAVGLAAVFAGAANTPLASTVIAIELFGIDIGVYAALGCAASYLVSGRHGIYAAQRLLYPKLKV